MPTPHSGFGQDSTLARPSRERFITGLIELPSYLSPSQKTLVENCPRRVASGIDGATHTELRMTGGDRRPSGRSISCRSGVLMRHRDYPHDHHV
jgi:hypothetical protein